MIFKLFSPLLKWALLAGLLVALVLLIRQNVRLSSDVARCNRNVEAATDSLRHLSLSDGRSSSQGEALEMRLSEVERYMPQVITEIRSMGVKPQRAAAISTTSFTGMKDFTTYLRDSITADTQHVRLFNYSDAWYNVQGIAKGDSQQVSISNTDTLVQVIYRGSRAKWWNPFSPRPLLQRCAFSNPSARINYQQTIQISKKP